MKIIKQLPTEFSRCVLCIQYEYIIWYMYMNPHIAQAFVKCRLSGLASRTNDKNSPHRRHRLCLITMIVINTSDVSGIYGYIVIVQLSFIVVLVCDFVCSQMVLGTQILIALQSNINSIYNSQRFICSSFSLERCLEPGEL